MKQKIIDMLYGAALAFILSGAFYFYQSFFHWRKPLIEAVLSPIFFFVFFGVWPIVAAFLKWHFLIITALLILLLFGLTQIPNRNGRRLVFTVFFVIWELYGAYSVSLTVAM